MFLRDTLLRRRASFSVLARAVNARAASAGRRAAGSSWLRSGSGLAITGSASSSSAAALRAGRVAGGGLSPLRALRALGAAGPGARCFATAPPTAPDGAMAGATTGDATGDAVGDAAGVAAGVAVGGGDEGLPPGVRGSGAKLVFMYTCTVCDTRSAKTVSKQAYEHGCVLIRCPGCENHHLIADHIGCFDSDKFDVVKLLEERGENVNVVRDGDTLELTEILGGLLADGEDGEAGGETDADGDGDSEGAGGDAGGVLGAGGGAPR